MGADTARGGGRVHGCWAEWAVAGAEDPGVEVVSAVEVALEVSEGARSAAVEQVEAGRRGRKRWISYWRN
jgi:hypothetical protein